MDTQLIETKKHSRNSALEILRLCASLWVMYYHGLSLITRSASFSNGRIAVDFFFLLSGFFFLNSYAKEIEKPIFQGLASFVWKRFRPLCVTFCICEVFSLLYFFANGMSGSIWGYLWYIPHLLVVFAIYFLLRRIIKNDHIFYGVVIIISAICYYLVLTYTVDYGIFRGLAGIGLGILISKIPKLNFKYSNIISILVTSILFVGITCIAIFLPIKTIEDPLCLLILFPSIIYFASNINFSSKVVNNICSISFGLYAYQTIIRYIQLINPKIPDGWGVAIVVFALATIDVIIKNIVRKKLKDKSGTK